MRMYELLEGNVLIMLIYLGIPGVCSGLTVFPTKRETLQYKNCRSGKLLTTRPPPLPLVHAVDLSPNFPLPRKAFLRSIAFDDRS